MKKLLFLIGGILSSIAINAQIINYSDAAVLFSNETNNGTARYNAMSGAFGALGGDLSAADVNPAGLAVFKNTNFSATFGLRNTDITSSFYGPNTLNNNNYLNLTQAGGVLVFNTKDYSRFKKIAIGFNYSISRDFENSWLASGNSFADGNTGFSPLSNFYDPNLEFEFADEQRFENFTNGRNNKYVLTFAAQSNENLYIGASLTTNNIGFTQRTFAKEFNNDGNGNTLDITASQELLTEGNGVSLSAGLIAKPIQEIRLGLSIQSPTWYQLSERRTIEDDEIITNGSSRFETLSDGGSTFFDYNLTTPAKFTGSFAYLFGKEGLISFDYTYKDFENIKLKPSGSFSDENRDFPNILKATSQYKIGAEWRIDNVSLRGGYHFEESPYENALDSDDITGYSFGIGFKFKTMKLDLSYQNSKNTNGYNFLNIEGANPVDLNITNDMYTATLVFGL